MLRRHLLRNSICVSLSSKLLFRREYNFNRKKLCLLNFPLFYLTSRSSIRFLLYRLH
uniref:Uncharacterized protein n=1 Tax=uncultured Desulfobacterales bacterium HF0200_07G10 TaxID=710741 RepID=E0XU36_9BACT|nr:hypothetical protein [uncultured Desulfobacterales bacterium HF0200_07G10]